MARAARKRPGSGPLHGHPM